MENQPASTLRLRGPRVLFRDVYAIVEDYIDRRVKVSTGARIEDVALGCYRNAVIERLVPAIELAPDAGQPMLLPVLAEELPSFSTAKVHFWTNARAYETRKSHVSHVVIEGDWESSAASVLEDSPNVVAYVKNDQPHFGIQYEWNGIAERYIPTFSSASTAQRGSSSSRRHLATTMRRVGARQPNGLPRSTTTAVLADGSTSFVATRRCCEHCSPMRQLGSDGVREALQALQEGLVPGAAHERDVAGLALPPGLPLRPGWKRVSCFSTRAPVSGLFSESSNEWMVGPRAQKPADFPY